MSTKQEIEKHRTVALQSYHRNRDGLLEDQRERCRRIGSAKSTIGKIVRKLEKQQPAFEPTAEQIEAKLTELRDTLTATTIEADEIIRAGIKIALDPKQADAFTASAAQRLELDMKIAALQGGIKEKTEELAERKAGDIELAKWFGDALKREVKKEQREILALAESFLKEHVFYLLETSRQLNRVTNLELQARDQPTMRADRDTWKYMNSQMITWDLYPFLLDPGLRDRHNWLGNLADSTLGRDPNAPIPAKKQPCKEFKHEVVEAAGSEREKRERFEREAAETAKELEEGRKRNEALAAKLGEKALKAQKEGIK